MMVASHVWIGFKAFSTEGNPCLVLLTWSTAVDWGSLVLRPSREGTPVVLLNGHIVLVKTAF